MMPSWAFASALVFIFGGLAVAVFGFARRALYLRRARHWNLRLTTPTERNTPA